MPNFRMICQSRSILPWWCPLNSWFLVGHSHWWYSSWEKQRRVMPVGPGHYPPPDGWWIVTQGCQEIIIFENVICKMSVPFIRNQCVNPSGAETRISLGDLGQYHGCWWSGSFNCQFICSNCYDNVILWTNMSLSSTRKRFKFQPPALSQYCEMIENANIFCMSAN